MIKYNINNSEIYQHIYLSFIRFSGHFSDDVGDDLVDPTSDLVYPPIRLLCRAIWLWYRTIWLIVLEEDLIFSPISMVITDDLIVLSCDIIVGVSDWITWPNCSRISSDRISLIFIWIFLKYFNRFLQIIY